MKNLYYAYVIRLQRSKVPHDVERFWYYETKEEAQSVANKLHGYKVTVERHYLPKPFQEMIKESTRYPKFNQYKS